jgi:hypothetical protein
MACLTGRGARCLCMHEQVEPGQLWTIDIRDFKHIVVRARSPFMTGSHAPLAVRKHAVDVWRV